MVLAYVLSAIMMKYTISYREVCYLVNRSEHTVVCALGTKLMTGT